MMMIYGMFVFELRTLPHQQLQQNKSWRHVKNERVNRSASWQYICICKYLLKCFSHFCYWCRKNERNHASLTI